MHGLYIHLSKLGRMMYTFLQLFTGCIVGIFANSKSISDQVVSGVVTKKSSTEVKVAFDELPGDADLFALAGRLQLVKMDNSATYKRIKK